MGMVIELQYNIEDETKICELNKSSEELVR